MFYELGLIRPSDLKDVAKVVEKWALEVQIKASQGGD